MLSQPHQANPLNHKQPDIHLMTGSRGMLAAKDPLVVPMLLRLSHFRLSSYVVLVVSKQKGITLVFKTDPLQHVDINSTFDSIAVIQNFIQREIEGQLRQKFREDLPGIIHRLSQQWVKAKVEAPYLNKRPPPPATTRHSFDVMSSFSQTPNISDIGLRRSFIPSRRPLSTSGSTSTRHSTRKPPPTPHSESPSSSSTSSHPDLENFDPTYGLRPEGLPSKSGFKGFSNLFTPDKGLADLAQESSEFSEFDEDDDERGSSFDLVDWEDTIPGISPTPSVYSAPRDSNNGAISYFSDVLPTAGPREVGGGVGGDEERSIIYMRRPPSERRFSVTSSTSTSNLEDSHNTGSSSSSSPPDRYVIDRQLRHHHHPLSQSSSSSPPSQPHSHHYHYQQQQEDPTKIVLRLSLNNSIHQFSTLSHSNHTLSPYTRDVSHFTVRSVPPRGHGHGGVGFTGGQGQGFERQSSVKAKRKRMYRLGKGASSPVVVNHPASASAAVPGDSNNFPSPQHNNSTLPAEFDLSDMDRYFRSYDGDLSSSRSPDSTPTIAAAAATGTGTAIRRRQFRDNAGI